MDFSHLAPEDRRAIRRVEEEAERENRKSPWQRNAQPTATETTETGLLRPDLSQLTPEQRAEMEALFEKRERSFIEKAERKRRAAQQTPEERAQGLRCRAEERRQRAREALQGPTADRQALDRARCNQTRQQAIHGIDLVATALSDPSMLTYPQCQALLGRVPYDYDELTFACKLMGWDPKDWSMYRLAVSFSNSPQRSLKSADMCKFVICDRRVPEGGDVERLDALYAEQLRMESEEEPLEKARAAVRDGSDKLARHYARAFLREYEAAAARGEAVLDATAIWDRVRPREPHWIHDICDGGNKYGFSVYKSAEVRSRPVALERWLSIFEDRSRSDNFAGVHACTLPLKNGNRLWRLIHADWVDESLHFAEHRKSLDKSSQILENTFIVITSDCVFPELDDHDLQPVFLLDEYGDETGTFAPLDPNNVLPEQVPTVFVWAYDANWVPPSPSASSLADGYEGRVKVRLRTLYSWFYFARRDGVHDLKDLWKKAQRHPEKIWDCEPALLDPSQPDSFV